ncbi:MAG: hypothetical protein IKO47_07135 [Ruminococcus sp.]|nr:hypothetical protein [Ruminococcus sp.]
MKKDDLTKGIDAVDDDLIAEAAGREPKMKYSTKVKLIRILTGAAAVAAMVATGFLLKASLGKPPKSSDPAAIVTEGKGSGDPEAVTEPGTDTVTSAVTSRAEEYVTYAKTTTKAGTKTVTGVTTVTKAVTMPDTDEPVTTTVPWTEERPFIYNGREQTFYPPMKDYTYPGDTSITNVQFGTAVLRDRGVWVNCSFDQADCILNGISAFQNADEIEDIGFDGGGFCVKVFYDDGTSREYELFGTLGLYYLKDQDGSIKRMKDTSGAENELVWYLQGEFVKIDPYITAFFEEKYGG